MALLVRINGSTQLIVPKQGKIFSLGELQFLVEGNIEMVHLPAMGSFMFVNEEGKLKDLPVNQHATLLCHEAGFLDIICGDVVFCDEEEAGMGDC